MNKKIVLAVSGGVDSMVMLDIAVKMYPKNRIVVATFDHGTRDSSSLDVDFVEETAKRHGLKVCVGKTWLGENASEEDARKSRYGFLEKVASNEEGEIFVAHHLDDLVESITINLLRGTGIRGLASMNNSSVHRPFIDGMFDKVYSKADILRYASEHEVIFRQDPTNSSDEYLRNRIRPLVLDMSASKKKELYHLWSEQKQIVGEIEDIINSLIPGDLKFERDWFMDIDENVAMEILRMALLEANISATRPQIKEFLSAIKTYNPGKKFNLPGDRLVRISKKDFELNI